MIRDTQIESWESVRKNLSERQLRVFETLIVSKNGLPLFRISEWLGWPINSVSGRVTELSDRGMIVDSGSREVNPATGRRAIVWKARQEFNEDQHGQTSFI